MPRNAMNPQHWTDFLRVLDTVPAGHHVSSNVLRDLLAAADIPEKSRGGLFSQAVNQGYLRPVANRYEASTGETANRAPVRLYRRTKQQQAVAA
ncbi:hypothetical protein ACFPJ1_40520 [Kribbella qitaiheensis]|uniref:hypothetical protein n=1 Tax=Kribbella qitaiheensis TaxID=1544730 RepID=UPI00361B32BC